MNATIQILEASGAPLEIETIEIGEKVYLRDNSSGIEPSAWDSLLRTKDFLKAPHHHAPGRRSQKPQRHHAQNPQCLYANVRPCVSYRPLIQTKHPNMDVVIVRRERRGLLCRHRVSG